MRISLLSRTRASPKATYRGMWGQISKGPAGCAAAAIVATIVVAARLAGGCTTRSRGLHASQANRHRKCAKARVAVPSQHEQPQLWSQQKMSRCTAAHNQCKAQGGLRVRMQRARLVCIAVCVRMRITDGEGPRQRSWWTAPWIGKSACFSWVSVRRKYLHSSYVHTYFMFTDNFPLFSHRITKNVEPPIAPPNT